MAYYAVVRKNLDYFCVEDRVFDTVEEASAFGIFWGLRLASLEYTGALCIRVSDFPETYFSLEEDTVFGPVVLRLFAGNSYTEALSGKDTDTLKFTPFWEGDIFNIRRIMDNNDFKLDIAISLRKEDKSPVVLLGDGTGYLEITPEAARQLGMDLIHAAEASESDSLIARVLDEVYTESELSVTKKKAFMDALRKLREEDYNAPEETKSEEIKLEEDSST